MTPQSPDDPRMPPRGDFNPEDRTPMEAYQAPLGAAGGNQSPRTWIWILVVVAVIIIGGLVICCGVVFWGYQAGAEQLASQVEAEIADDPAIQEHIGEIESLELSLQKSAELGQQGRVVLPIKGSKGEGVIIGSQQPGTNQLSDLVLETADGEQYPLEE